MLHRNKRGPGQHKMAIGEFGGAPMSAGRCLSTGLYWLYEMSHAALNPSRAFADVSKLYFNNPLNPLTRTQFGKTMAATAELFERTTRRYGKPEWTDRFHLGRRRARAGACQLRVGAAVLPAAAFRTRASSARRSIRSRRFSIVAPMSGHYATLLRGTVEAFLPNHDVYITDWVDARMVPVSDGPFDLDDYIDYVISILHRLGGDYHVIAVCQPSVPVLAAAALMEANNDPYAPRSIVLMGGPIDTRINPTGVNQLAEERGIEWFRRNVITKVPFPHPGVMRDVYPGFLQLYGFVSMNFDRHLDAHQKLFFELVAGDGDSAQKHREFYDEYLAVMDLTAEFYLQTVDTVFVRHALPKGEMTHRGTPVDPAQIRRCRTADDRRRARRHFRRRTDRGRAPAVREYSRRAQGALSAARRRPLWRVQRLALPRRNRAAHLRLHPLE